MAFNLEDRPPWPILILYGLQWWVVTLPCVVVTGVVVAALHYPDWPNQVWYLQKLFLAMGLISLAQITLGHRLPLVIGPATVLMVGLAATTEASIGALYTAMALGGALMAILGFTNRMAALRRFFTTRIVAVILILIAFTLSPVMSRLILGPNPQTGLAQAGPALVLAIILLLALVVTNELLKGSLKSLTMPLGLMVGTLAYRFFLPAATAVSQAPSPRLPRAGLFLSPSFELGPILAFVMCFLALIVNEMSSTEAVGRMLKAPDMDARVRRGVGMTGLGSLFSGLLGVIGPVDYTMSVGLISATSCAARLTFIPAALALMASALAPSFIAILVSIPQPIMGAVLLYSMVSQLSGGLSLLVSERAVANYLQGLVVGLPLMIGLLIAFAPAEVFHSFPSILRPIIANGFVMGTLLVIALEHLLIPKTAQPTSQCDP
ncbi:MAG: purine/pyrimidine permease [Deltaproteobacteria bacterium]|nr:purine/pyrimidine permease [Deltaproteobacteria bacterium]